jgi:hypothetical protein
MKYWPWYVALGMMSFIVVAGGVIGSRLSEQTLAFMAGVIFGGVAALPIGAVIGWATKSPRQTDRAYAPPPQPPIILTPPQPYPSMSSAQPYSAAQQIVSTAPSARREFTTIGEEELAYHESESVW